MLIWMSFLVVFQSLFLVYWLVLFKVFYFWCCQSNNGRHFPRTHKRRDWARIKKLIQPCTFLWIIMQCRLFHLKFDILVMSQLPLALDSRSKSVVGARFVSIRPNFLHFYGLGLSLRLYQHCFDSFWNNWPFPPLVFANILIKDFTFF